MSAADFKLLGLPTTATREQVKVRFYKLADEHHPDHGGDPEKFQELCEAYKRLKTAPCAGCKGKGTVPGKGGGFRAGTVPCPRCKQRRTK